MVTSNKPHDRIPELKPGYVLAVDFDEIDEFEGRAKKFRIGDEDPRSSSSTACRAAPTASGRKTTR